jgi:RHS repeat-associated protein
MMAWLPSSQTITTGGLALATSMTRKTTLADPKNPLSLTKQTDTTTINGRNYISVFDAFASTMTNTSPAGRQRTFSVSPQGRITQAQVSGILPVMGGYDANGRLAALVQGTGADERRLSFAYNPQGYLQNATDPLGRTLNFEYDAGGRIVREVLPDGREVHYDYDAKGNMVSLTPPGRPSHVFQYTNRDQASEYDPPDAGASSGSTLYEYDLDKSFTRITRPDGQTIDFTYNSAGRLSLQTMPHGTLTYSYNASTGKVASIADPDGGSLAFTYNGALLTKTTWVGAITGNVGFTYDNDFRVTGVSINNANTIAFQYDADSLLTKAGDLTLSRNSQNGLLTGAVLGQVSDSLTYDAFGEVARYEASAGSTVLLAADYTYDKLGRITRKVETMGGVSDTFDYTYDQAGRLTEVDENGATAAVYAYDSNGNRLSHTKGATTTTATYDDQDRLVTYGGASFTYTANGELESKTEGAATTIYQYDVVGNLRQVTLPDGGRTIDYVIDAANRRVGKKIDGTLVQGFLYQDKLKPAVELDGSGAIVSRFVYATHVNVPDYMVKGGNTYRIITDHLGSPRLVVNTADGEIAQKMEYDEFGNVTSDSNPGFQPFGFAGGLYDRDTGLVRFGARDYDPEVGRWTAKDPILFAGGDTNLFGYVQNNPVNWIDKNGLSYNPPEISGSGTTASGYDPYDLYDLCVREGLVTGLGEVYDLAAKQEGEELEAMNTLIGIMSGPFGLPMEIIKWNSPETNDGNMLGEILLNNIMPGW